MIPPRQSSVFRSTVPLKVQKQLLNSSFTFVDYHCESLSHLDKSGNSFPYSAVVTKVSNHEVTFDIVVPTVAQLILCVFNVVQLLHFLVMYRSKFPGEISPHNSS